VAAAPRRDALNIGADQIQHAILYLIAFILSITVHEFGHAWVANRLGDPTPRSQGRVTLSPQHHIDPIGTILMPILMALSASASLPLLAWGRPVQTNPAAYTRRFSMSTGRMMVSIAGPFMNLVMAFVVSLGIVVAARLHAPDHLISTVFHYLVRLNISLMVFNLLPIPPLDGGAVLAWVLPRSMHNVVDFLARYGSFILLFLVISPSLGLPLMRVIGYPIDLIMSYWILGLGMAMGS
jgi:Zn-dependent protease